jgi:NodT family efflux transporter outer membrane factor (OMF) lipoprotein
MMHQRTDPPYLPLILSLWLLGAISGCAPMPELGPLADAKAPETLISTQTLKAPEATWPDDRWWEKYNDAQLNQLIAEGLADAPDLKAAQARLRRSEAQSQSVGSVLYPQLSANGTVFGQEVSTNYIVPAPYTPQGWYSYGQATLNFNWEIDFWGKNRAALAAAVSESQARRADVAQARLILTTAIARSYADLARLMADRATAEKALDIRTKTWALFGERQKQGLENTGAVSQAEGKKHLAENDLVQIDVRIAETRNRLAALVGAGPDRGLQINPPKTLVTTTYALPPDLGINLVGRRPDIVATRWQAEASQSRIEQRKAAFYPNVNIAAFVGGQSLGINKLIESGSYMSNAGPAIYLPIFLGGKLRADLNAARADYDENVANYEKTLIQALNEVADVAAGLQQLNKQVRLADQSVAAQTQGLTVAANRYKGGLANYLDVLVAEDELLSSWRVQTDVRTRAFILDVALTKALGGGYQTDAAADRRQDKKSEEFPR